jgi:hypothetical protein
VSDIFISYAREDRDWVLRFADGLAQRDWSLWRDERDIEIGKHYDKVIDDALKSAKRVIVVWSRASVKSNWVAAEAAEALRRGTLVPALIEQVEPPLEFRRLQTVDLSGWKPGIPHDGYEKLVREIAAHLGTPIGDVPAAEPRPSLDQPSAPAAQSHWKAKVEKGGAFFRRLRVENAQAQARHLLELECQFKTRLFSVTSRALVSVDNMLVAEKALERFPLLTGTESCVDVHFNFQGDPARFDVYLLGIVKDACFDAKCIIGLRLFIAEQLVYAEGNPALWTPSPESEPARPTRKKRAKSRLAGT